MGDDIATFVGAANDTVSHASRKQFLIEITKRVKQSERASKDLLKRLDTGDDSRSNNGSRRDSLRVQSDKKVITSDYRGVYWNASSNCWRARIWHDGKSTHIGNYKDEEAAARAFDRRAVALGKLTSLNFPDELDKIEETYEACAPQKKWDS